jgi:hypothetical protein
MARRASGSIRLDRGEYDEQVPNDRRGRSWGGDGRSYYRDRIDTDTDRLDSKAGEEERRT